MSRSRWAAPVALTLATLCILVAHPASSAQLWVRRYNGPGNSSDNAWALGVSPDGTAVYVTGSSLESTGSTDYATVAYDTSTGTELCVRDPSGRPVWRGWLEA